MQHRSNGDGAHDKVSWHYCSQVETAKGINELKLTFFRPASRSCCVIPRFSNHAMSSRTVCSRSVTSDCSSCSICRRLSSTISSYSSSSSSRCFFSSFSWASKMPYFLKSYSSNTHVLQVVPVQRQILSNVLKRAQWMAKCNHWPVDTSAL